MLCSERRVSRLAQKLWESQFELDRLIRSWIDSRGRGELSSSFSVRPQLILTKARGRSGRKSGFDLRFVHVPSCDGPFLPHRQPPASHFSRCSHRRLGIHRKLLSSLDLSREPNAFYSKLRAILVGLLIGVRKHLSCLLGRSPPDFRRFPSNLPRSREQYFAS